ncbi:SDR family oxidoreductase [Hydrogenophaga sp. BPS33]|uniref:SDR family oxidoreductase n=1 Tax=Hydrogenophaga sp. BPS33 TaxID=2651974 RepID=UPI0013203C67|nr:SDR family NAD(P)-dependent oxidoreductase [Hydrogenophaga sp. BPS33]QHE84668.1 SDR family oxidoreductase [Hydrogenophaga sp. BPS33]
MDLGLVGKVAFVTGAGRGIGVVTAQYLATEGVAVVTVDQDADAAEATAAAINASGGRAVGLGCDVTRADEVVRAVNAATGAFGRLDILVNNAGVVKDRSLLKMEEADWDIVVDVTLKGSFNCCKAAIPEMHKNGWGRIINISSRSIFGNPGQTNYSAAKAGVIGFTRALSLEQAKRGITVNAIAPGFIETEGMKSIPNYDKLREAAIQKTPVGFLGEPRDVASTVAFMASEQARYISGTTVFVTGGRFSS